VREEPRSILVLSRKDVVEIERRGRVWGLAVRELAASARQADASGNFPLSVADESHDEFGQGKMSQRLVQDQFKSGT